MRDLKIGFIGGGNMARALIRGLLDRGLPAGQIRVGEPLAAGREELGRLFGIASFADNATAVAGVQLLVLAVKPQQLAAAAVAISAGLPRPGPVVLSIAGGVRTQALGGWLPGLPVVRAMPNRAALVGAGITALFAGPDVQPAARALAEQVLSAAGRCVWVAKEALLDVVTAVSGSGPAYFFLLAEQLAAAGKRLGLDAATAQLLATETLFGAGKLVHADPDLAGQRAAVASKGGTTEAALKVMHDGGLAALIDAAVTAAAQRGTQMADEFGSS
jgi:pyrroline-5-carboxylate reductase